MELEPISTTPSLQAKPKVRQANHRILKQQGLKSYLSVLWWGQGLFRERISYSDGAKIQQAKKDVNFFMSACQTLLKMEALRFFNSSERSFSFRISF